MGFPLAVLFLVVLISGEYIAVSNLLSRLNDHNQTYSQSSIEQTGKDLTNLLVRFPNASNYAIPRPDAPFYRISNRGDVHIISTNELQLLHHTTSNDGALRRWFLGLHRNYLKGRDGRHIVAWVSILSVIISIVGVVTWYPYRRMTRLKEVVPTSFLRPKLFRAHFTGGLVGVVAVIILGLTGASITYRSVARDVLSIERNAPPPRFEAPFYVPKDWPTRLALAQDYFPDGTLTLLAKPRNQPRGQNLVEIRFSASGDWSQLGDSAVILRENDSSFIGVRRFGKLKTGEKLYRMIRPLHDGTAMPLAYLWFLVIANGFLIIMVFAGLFSFFQKTYGQINLPMFNKL